MINAKTYIRETIKSYLEELPFLKGIYFNDPESVERKNIPCVYYAVENESITYPTLANLQNGRLQQRVLDFSLILYIKKIKDEELVSTYENYSGLIENALCKDKTRSTLNNKNILFVNLKNIAYEMSDDGENDFATVLFSYEVVYRVNEREINL